MVVVVVVVVVDGTWSLGLLRRFESVGMRRMTMEVMRDNKLCVAVHYEILWLVAY